MSARPLTILFSGMIAGTPRQGGATWAVLQYVLGLMRLGHDVYLAEPIDSLETTHREDVSDYFHRIIREFELSGRAALTVPRTRESIGIRWDELRAVAARADLLINVSGMLSDEALIARIPTRAYLDLDPAFNQLWHVQGIDMRLDVHTHFITIGQAIGDNSECSIPTCGRRWIKTFQPVVLDYWPVADPVEDAALTTIGNWRGYGSIEHNGVHYGQKCHSLRQFIDLPRRAPRELFELAMAIHPDEVRDLEALRANGWGLLDPSVVACGPREYAAFIRASKAEVGIAKAGYVTSRCGWFSDRSACYLASGRPVIAQETGFSKYLPIGEGLFPFRTVEDVIAAIGALRDDYVRHCRAARALAEEYFESEKVLTRLLAQLGFSQ